MCVDAISSNRFGYQSSYLGHIGCILLFLKQSKRNATVSDDQIFYVIAISLALTVCWIGASMIFGPF